MPTDLLRAVVFDLDGLLFNTEDLYRQAGREVLRRRGKLADEAMFVAMMGRPPASALQLMVEWHGLSDSVEQLERESYEVLRPIIAREVAPLAGVESLLDALEAAEIPKAIATSSRRAFVADVLGRFDWQRRFAFVLTSEDVARGKPDPEIYLSAAARFGLSAAETLVLEDSPHGCQAGVAAGAYTVAVPSDYTRHHDFPGAALIADGLTDRRIYDALRLDGA